jgi:hypothetical protein
MELVEVFVSESGGLRRTGVLQRDLDTSGMLCGNGWFGDRYRYGDGIVCRFRD